MYVVPERRNRGIARALLGGAESRARDLGYTKVRLDTGALQPTALALYERAGYRRIDPYNDNPFAAFWGEKRSTTSTAPEAWGAGRLEARRAESVH